MEKLTLEQIAPYLPYGLKIVFKKYRMTDGEMTEYIEGISGIKTSNGELIIITELDEVEISEARPLLRPMDLTKSIIVEGKEIIPILELANIYQKSYWELTHEGFAINEDLSEEFGIRYGCFSVMDTTYDLQHLNQLPLFQWLFKHKFDVFGIIEKGLAIDVNTLETNPYNS